MSAPAGAQRDPRPSVVSMRTLLAAGVAATAVSTPPAREGVPGGPEDGAREEAAPESEAA
ncbi:hypothetical protein PV721_23455 [Streptomyces sp. MB09-01]|uniref:hypothetical protein n=1 Tax=Streptomyces sp. MB09-01 TaxID=3028666 RepID=UPI0029ABB64B|nr:hypothetical protein [Streptomyces sp. MB09-01]MDX3537278.1 hypothetical protein [Streptomyces sp. MB09-01]